MAQNIFDATFDANNRIDVNSFDWSHVNNLTTDFGRITPVFCELVPAKGSLRINPEFGLELMPMVFPVQTRMFARLNFFKVTLRSLWEDYSDFISNFRDDLEEPYVLPSENTFTRIFKTGKLADYLGVPTFGIKLGTTVSLTDTPSASGQRLVYKGNLQEVIDGILNGSARFSSTNILNTAINTVFSLNEKSTSVTISPDASSFNFVCNFSAPLLSKLIKAEKVSFAVVHSGNNILYRVYDSPTVSVDSNVVKITLDNLVKESFPEGVYGSFFIFVSLAAGSGTYNFSDISSVNSFMQLVLLQSELSYDTFPFATVDRPNNKHLLAYRFRAYESVYNAYYRDIRNNPFVVNGRPVYNKWLPNMKGGADRTLYELHQCNWERDFLTTAVPNPQQGANAPLVGLVMGDVVTRSEDGTYSVQKQTVLVDEDGSKYGLSYKVSEDGERLVGVDYDPVSEKTPVTAINSYAELAALATEQGSGFTIETLRYVNAYQKFLELNMRKGFSYKQIMQGRWDIDIRFDELLMPEFIGGISRELSMRTVEQTVDQQGSTSQGQYAEALGSKTGIAGVYGNTSNNIEVFCDEESYIIGLLTVTPVPIYTQLLPKDFTYNGLLDHYQPEFDRIGFQPITYKEICPMNVAADDSTEALDRTFGYQRPWYEYVAKYDSAHGLFRTNMKNFIMSRVFSGLPQLGQEFLLVDPGAVNQVFSVTEYTDKIFGYVKFNATARLPISRVAIPRLD